MPSDFPDVLCVLGDLGERKIKSLPLAKIAEIAKANPKNHPPNFATTKSLPTTCYSVDGTGLAGYTVEQTGVSRPPAQPQPNNN
jgi:hypothetical protein